MAIGFAQLPEAGEELAVALLLLVALHRGAGVHTLLLLHVEAH